MLKILNSQKIQIILIIVFTFLAYSNIFRNGMVADDRAFIVGWESKKSLGNISQFFKGDVPLGHEGVYRPLRSVLYAVYYQIFGTNLFGYHLHSILVHLVSTVLVYLIVRELVPFTRGPAAAVSRRVSSVSASWRIPAGTRRDPSAASPLATYLPFITSVLFGLHPIHTETITYIASAMESTSILFFFLTFYLYIKGKKYYLWSVLSAAVAFFTSEITLTLPILLLLYDVCFKKVKSQKSKVYLPYILLASLYLFIRFVLLGITNRGPYLADSIYLTFLTMTKVLVKYIGLSILPLVQAHNQLISKGIEAFVYPEYKTSAIQAQSIFDLDVLISLVLIVGLVVAAIKIKEKIPLITFGVFWFFISLLPVLEIVPQGAIMNEKFLYIPSFGFCLLISYLIVRIYNLQSCLSADRFSFFNQFSNSKFKNYFLVTCFLLLVACYFLLTYQRNKDWHDEITFWTHDTKVYPNDNAYAYLALGAAYHEKKQFGKAETAYKTAIKINPNYVTVHNNLGKIYEEESQVDLAITEYKKAFSAGYKSDRIWLEFPYHNKLLVSFPSSWEMRENNGGIYFQNGFAKLDLQIKTDSLPGSADQMGEFNIYLKQQKNKFDKPEMEGLAKLPFFDAAYTKRWMAKREFDKGEIWQFLLLKDRDVANVIFYPVNLQTHTLMDNILIQLRFLSYEKH